MREGCAYLGCGGLFKELLSGSSLSADSTPDTESEVRINVAHLSLNKREAQFQTKFGRWVQYAYKGPTFAFELKRSLTDSLPYSEIKDHQFQSLKNTQSSAGMYYKIPDDSRSFKPLDGVFLRDEWAYLCVAYGTRLQGFYMIDIVALLRHYQSRPATGRGATSLTEDHAKLLGQYHELPRKSQV